MLVRLQQRCVGLALSLRLSRIAAGAEKTEGQGREDWMELTCCCLKPFAPQQANVFC